MGGATLIALALLWGTIEVAACRQACSIAAPPYANPFNQSSSSSSSSSKLFYDSAEELHLSGSGGW